MTPPKLRKHFAGQMESGRTSARGVHLNELAGSIDTAPALLGRQGLNFDMGVSYNLAPPRYFGAHEARKLLL
jgi:hypothetical protein